MTNFAERTAPISDLQLASLPASPMRATLENLRDLRALSDYVGRLLSVVRTRVDGTALDLRNILFGSEAYELHSSFSHFNPSVPSRILSANLRLQTICQEHNVKSANAVLDTVLPGIQRNYDGGGSKIDFGCAELEVMQRDIFAHRQKLNYQGDILKTIKRSLSGRSKSEAAQTLALKLETITKKIISAEYPEYGLAELLNLDFQKGLPWSGVVSRIPQALDYLLSKGENSFLNLPAARLLRNGVYPELSWTDLRRDEILAAFAKGEALPSWPLLVYLICKCEVIHFGNIHGDRQYAGSRLDLFLPNNVDGPSVGTVNIKISHRGRQSPSPRSLACIDLALFDFDEYKRLITTAAETGQEQFKIQFEEGMAKVLNIGAKP